VGADAPGGQVSLDNDPQVRPTNRSGAVSSLLRCWPMTTPAETKRKFQQLDNDVVEIYSKLDRILDTQRLHGDRLTKIEIKVTELDNKVTGLETKITGLDNKVTELDNKVTGLDTKVTGLETKITELDAKIDRKVGDLDRRLTGKLDEVIRLLERRPIRRTALRWRR
jgi:chromosome segregation ATPase